MSSAVQFNVEVSEIVANSVANATKECIRRILETTSLRHGFDLEAELQALGLDSLLLVKKPMGKKSVEKVEKEKKSKPVVHKSKCPIPFTGEIVNGCCGGLAYNRGLFTQCLKKHMDSGKFCEKCQSEADKNASGIPDCGTVAERLITGLYAFKDPKGRSPEPYSKILEKMEMSAETALEEAGKLNIRIQPEHFTFTGEKKAGGGRGRPKKAVAVAIEGDNAVDLFANITPDKPIEEVVVEEVVVEKAPSKGLSEEEKAKKKEALLEQRALQKAELDKKKAQEKEADKAKKAQEKEAEKAKKEAEKAKKEAEKAKKEAEKEAEKEAKKEAEKEAKKTKKETKKPNVVAVVPEPDPVVVADTVVKVTKIQVNGKAYLKSSNNVLYDPETKTEVGIWDPETKTMKDLPETDEEDEVVSDKEDEEDEEDEEEYEN
jgi:chemotaxis protein histidine kinase CheA